LKSSEIQQFRGIFLFLSPTKKCRFKKAQFENLGELVKNTIFVA